MGDGMGMGDGDGDGASGAALLEDHMDEQYWTCDNASKHSALVMYPADAFGINKFGMVREL